MNENIIYLTKSPIFNNNGLVFPSEIEDKNYYGTGNLYIPNDRLNPIYNIQAIYNEQIITIELTLKKDNIYTCNVTDIGKFNFYVEKLYKPLEYIGNIQRYQNKSLHYRLRLMNTNKAEYCVRKHDFYFIGNE